jgi:hypothetical protein
MTVTLTYDSGISRVRVRADVDSDATYGTVERSANGVQWTTVRGASELTPTVPAPGAGAAALRSNNAEGGTDGANVTAGSSTGGTPWDAVVLPSGIGTATFSLVVPAGGSTRSVVLQGGNGGGVSGTLRWTIAATPLLYATFKFRENTLSTGWAFFYGAGGIGFTVGTAGTAIALRSQAGATLAIGTGVLLANTWYRVDLRVEVGVRVDIKVFDAAGALVDSASYVGAAVSADITTLEYGRSRAVGQVHYVDDMAYGTAGYLNDVDWVPGLGFVTVDDYEFAPGMVNTYRVRGFSDVDVQLSSETNTITPVIDRVWLKSIARPFLNRGVTTRDYSPPTRRSRAGRFDIGGRTLPVVVSPVMCGREWTHEVLTYSLEEAHAVDLLLASGDVIFIQVPPGYDIPGGYVGVSDIQRARISRPLSDDKRQFSVPVFECAAPGPDVVGYTATWEGLLAEYGSWTAVLAQFATWADVLEYVSDPETVLVP